MTLSAQGVILYGVKKADLHQSMAPSLCGHNLQLRLKIIFQPALGLGLGEAIFCLYSNLI